MDEAEIHKLLGPPSDEELLPMEGTVMRRWDAPRALWAALVVLAWLAVAASVFALAGWAGWWTVGLVVLAVCCALIMAA